MTARRALSLLTGGMQCVFGGIASVVAYLVYASHTVREGLSISGEEVPLFMFLFLVFGMLSIISGLLLVGVRGGD